MTRAIFFAGAVFAGASFCAPVTWTLHNATFNDGGTASGSFVFDADTGAVSNWNIVTSAGTALAAFTYTPANSAAGTQPSAGCPAPCLSFGSNQTFPNGLPPPYNFNETRDLNFTFASPLTDAGGTVNLNLTASDECLDCAPYRLFTAGAVLGASGGPAVAGQLTVSLMTDNSGQPGSIVATASLSGFGTVPSIQSAAFVSNPALTAGTNYWLVVATPDPVNNSLGWDRVSTQALNAQAVGSGAWTIFSGSEGTLQIMGTGGTILFNNFLPGNAYDTTSGWTIGAGAENKNAGYRQGFQFSPTVSGTAQSISIAAFAKTIGASGNLAVVSTSLVNGVTGASYSQSLAASGGTPPYSSWAVSSGTLPPGLTLNSSTGVISGTPTSAGTYNFSVTVKDSTGNASNAVTLTINISSANGASLSVAPAALNFRIQQGAPAQSQSIQIGGTAATAWQATAATVTGGTWLSVSPAAGQIPASIAATVNPSGLAAGTYQGNITIQAPGAMPASITISVTVTPGSQPTDTIENLVFTGTATCTEAYCSHFGSGPLTGTYSLDVTSQTIVGAWTFSGPFGTISSSDAGATATVSVSSVIEPLFQVDTATVLEFVKINFPSSDVQQLGTIVTGPGTDACINVPGGLNGKPACAPDYLITGSTSLVSASGPPLILRGGAVPLYSTVSTIQPGEWVSIYGVNLASSTAAWNGDFPTSLGGSSVTINGKPAYLSFVSPTQINLQAPDDTTLGPVPVVVTNGSGSASATVTLARFAPSFLLLDSKHVAGVIPRSDGSGAYGGGSYDILGPTGNSLGYPTVAAKAGETVELFAVGLGPTSPAVPSGQAFSSTAPVTNPVSLFLNNASLAPAFAGLSAAGLYQVNLTVPANLGTGDFSLVAAVGGAGTQSGVLISLESPIVAQLQGLTLSASAVAGGGSVTGTVYLSAPAPSGGAVMSLSSSSSAASVPATVTVPAGATSAAFTVSAASVSSSQTVTITASYGGKSVQAALSVVVATGSNGNCQAVTQGPYTFQVVNTLPTDILVYFGDVILPSGQHGSISFGAQMHPNECDIIGLPQIASYSVAVNRYPNGTAINNTLTFTDTASGFIFNGRSAYTLRVTQGTCSAAADQSITFNGKSVYSLCLP